MTLVDGVLVGVLVGVIVGVTLVDGVLVGVIVGVTVGVTLVLGVLYGGLCISFHQLRTSLWGTWRCNHAKFRFTDSFTRISYYLLRIDFYVLREVLSLI